MKPIKLLYVLTFILSTTSFLSCKKSTSEPDPIAITVTPEHMEILFRVNEGFDEIMLRFQYNNKNYVAHIRYTTGAASANVETTVTNTQFVPTNAVLSDYGGSVAPDGQPNILKSDKLNTATTFKITFKSFREASAYVGSVKLFKEINFSLGAQTKVPFHGPTSAMYTRYINDPVAFSGMVQSMLNTFNDNDAATSGNQPMYMDGWIEEF